MAFPLRVARRFDKALHGTFQGPFAETRQRLDFSYHVNYSLERQRWQDAIVANVLGRDIHRLQRPWIVFTCGAMGSGKGFTMGWLSRVGTFPIENIIRVDPDYFKLVTGSARACSDCVFKLAWTQK